MTIAVATPFPHSRDHLAAELMWLNLLLDRAMADARSDAAAPVEAFRGLYVSDSDADRLLRRAGLMQGCSSGKTANDDCERMRSSIDARLQSSINTGVPLALLDVANVFGLSRAEQSILLLALSPELNLAYEKIVAYLQDDFNCRRPNVELALKLFCRDAAACADMLRLLAPSSPLLRFGVLRPFAGNEAPLLARPLVPDEQIVDYVSRRDPGSSVSRRPVQGSLERLRWPPAVWQSLFDLIRSGLCDGEANGGLVCQLHGAAGIGRKSFVRALCEEAGKRLLVVDVRELLTASADFEQELRSVFRKAALLRAVVHLDHADALTVDEAAAARHRDILSDAIATFDCITFLSMERPWSPSGLFGDRRFLSIHLPLPDMITRERLWRQFADEAGFSADDVDWGDLSARFRLSPGQMRAALNAARDLTVTTPVAAAAPMRRLVEGCYAQSNSKLASLARRLPSRRDWNDLVLPSNARAQLLELCAQIRHRRRVYEEWGFAANASTGKGICALFYGPSGAGKTIAAEVIGNDLQLQTYKIDLSVVVSKYIGETEKNLSRLFDEAESSNAILFFDEADALFGKRSEVKDAHDRYANIETSYLLQRIEEFDGLVILASNLRKNIDDSFFRRMHFAVEFPLPDAEHRYLIWRRHIPPQADLSKDVDLAFLAERLSVAGGNIRNITVNAAFLAAEQRSEIRMEHFIRAARREYEKIGLAYAATDFGPYRSMLERA